MGLDLGFVLLFINYLILASTFIYAYLKPKEWNEWLVSSYLVYFITYALSLFMVFFIAASFSQAGICFFIPTIFWSIVIIFAVKFSLDELGRKSIIPFALYILSMGQMFLQAYFSSNPASSFSNIAISYLFGFFVIFFGGKALGWAVGKATPGLSYKHLSIMRINYGEQVPSTIRFKNGFSVSNISPSDFVGIGIAYCIWMIVSLLIWPIA